MDTLAAARVGRLLQAPYHQRPEVLSCALGGAICRLFQQLIPPADLTILTVTDSVATVTGYSGCEAEVSEVAHGSDADSSRRIAGSTDSSVDWRQLKISWKDYGNSKDNCAEV